MIRVINEIRLKFGVSIGAIELLKNQTVETLAHLIEHQPATKQEPRIVQLQKGTQEPPLYFIYAGPDEAGLATLMGKGRAVFGIVVPWPKAWRHAAETRRKSAMPGMEQLVAPYATMLGAHLRSSSCVLAGHSFAGNIAFELARQLQKQGGRVEAVILFDTWAKKPSLSDIARYLVMRPSKRPSSQSPSLEVFGGMAGYLRKAMMLARLLAGHFKAQALSTLRLNQPRPTTILDEEGVPVDGDLLNRVYDNILNDYRPQHLDTKGVLFRADSAGEIDGGILGKDQGWAGVFGRGLEVVFVTGDHLSIVRSKEHNLALVNSMGEVLKRLKLADVK